MTVKHLIEILGRVASPGVKVPGDYEALQELASDLAEHVAAFAERSQAAGQDPGTLHVEHLVWHGIDMMLIAHEAIERERQRAYEAP